MSVAELQEETELSSKYDIENSDLKEYINNIVKKVVKETISTDTELQNRFRTIEDGHIQLLEAFKRLENNLTLYREDTKYFMEKVFEDNRTFRNKINDDIKSFRKEVDERFEKIDQRFEKIDQRFEKIDQRFEKIEQRFERMDMKILDIHSAINDINRSINRMTIFFVGSISTVAVILKVIDKIWA